MKTLILFLGLITSLLAGELVDRFLPTPLFYAVAITQGYDSNVLRLSSWEQELSAQDRSLLGSMNTFDSYYIRSRLSVSNTVYFQDRSRRVTSTVDISRSHYVQSPDRQHWRAAFKLSYRWGAYQRLTFYISRLNRYYLRDYLDRDVSDERLAKCYFSDEDHRLTLSYPLQKRVWFTGTVGLLQRYYSKPFPEFDLNIKYLGGRVNIRLPFRGVLGLESEIGKADNIGLNSTARASGLDRGYEYWEVYFPLKFTLGWNGLEEIGTAFRGEFRYYRAETFDDPLHSGRNHRDTKFDVWGRQRIGDHLSLKFTLRWRQRTTYSTYSWVEDLKSFHQIQTWLQLDWEGVYDRY